MKKYLLLLGIFLFLGLTSASAQVKVTFSVDMSVWDKNGYFNHKIDTVRVAGDFNGWSTTATALTAGAGADSLKYSVQASGVTTGAHSYKFIYINSTGVQWENDPNRTATIGSKDTVLSTVFFNNITGKKNFVWFKVDMAGPSKQGKFNPSKDTALVAGSFNGWNSNSKGMTKGASDTTYSILYDSLFSGSTVQFKYVYRNGNVFWEDDPNRKYLVPEKDSSVFFDYWNRTNPNVTITDGNIFFEVDMSVASELGVFNPNVDSVQIRGSFNGWNGSDVGRSHLNQDPANPNAWYLNIPFVKYVLNDSLPYKFFIQNGASSIPYSNTGWEVYIGKTSDIDRNRRIVFEGKPTQVAPKAYFEGIHTDWVIPKGMTVTAEFSVDMTPATQAGTQGTNPVFRPTVDTVYWIPRQPLYYALNKLEWTTDQRVLRLNSAGNNIFKGTLTIKGPAFNGFLYNYAYTSTAGFIQEDGGQGGARVRFIGQKGGPRKFDSPWTMPKDVWTNGDKPEEAGPITLVRESGITALTYELNQNFPNPFNPSTTIKFQIQNTEHVTLRVFNLLGQEVATLVNEELKSGSYRVNFDGKSLASGVYFYKIESGSFTSVKKMMFLK